MEKAKSLQTTAADAILRLMESYAVDTVFSIPGIHTIDFYKSFPERRIRHVTPRHEQGGAFMAYGYGFATGRPAACMLITGPGVLNAATGISEAYSDSIPVLVIAANNLRAELGVGRGALHETRSQSAVQEQIAAFSHTLLDVSNLEEVLHRALSLMEVARPRPVVIEVPRDLLSALTSVDPERKVSIFRPAPQPDAVRQAATLLRDAKRPLIIAGGGARDAGEDVQNLARHLDIPVVTTNTGKGILPETDPLSLGSSLPFRSLQAEIEAADVVLAVGTELSETDLLYTGNSYKITGSLIRVDIDARQLTINHLPEVGILSDAGEALKAIRTASGGAKARDKGAAPRVAALRKEIDADTGWSVESPKHKRVLTAMSEVLEPDAIICADSTQLAYTGNHFYPSLRPSCWLFPNGYGTLGSAMPAAVGAKIGCPDRQVTSIVGDGSFLYSIEELTTAVENNVTLPIIVWNNRAYGEIRDAMVAAGIPTVGVDLYTPDFQTLARGFGCEAIRIESIAQFKAELAQAFQRSKPTVIEIDNDAPMFAESGAT